LIAEWRAATAGLDAVVTPGGLGTAPHLDSVSKFYFLQVPLVTCPANTTGDPSIAVPAGKGSDGMPLAIQITGRPFDEAMVLKIADAFQQARGAAP
jgi:aspartyl-tRNA(Asn)/glutamyl-tRNA(Gln) amidotransferase subunit A